MRRIAVFTGALTVVASLAVSASATASAGPSLRPSGANVTALHHSKVTKDGAVTPGSKWSLFYFGWEGAGNICESLTFAAHTFLGDNTSTGSWSGNIKLTFTGGIDYQAGDIYKGKLKKSGTYAGDFVGSVTFEGTAYSPFVLEPGALC